MSADLTIIMPSWNKEKFIAKALDSIFVQKTTYSYHIIVADDHSTDSTLKIVREYSSRHPGVFTVLESDVNQKLFRNVRRAYAICKTPYFCVLDPDDFWIDELKIQKALDYLTLHPEVTIYATDTLVLNKDGSTERFLGYSEERDSTFQEFLTGDAYVGNTLGSVFRNVVFKHGLPPKLFGDLPADQEIAFRGDYFRNAIHIHEGYAHFVPECDAVYRTTDNGVWQGMSEFRRKVQSAESQFAMNDYFDAKYPQFRENALSILRAVRRNLYELVILDSDVESLVKAFCTLKRMSGCMQIGPKGFVNRLVLRIYKSLAHYLYKTDCI